MRGVDDGHASVSGTGGSTPPSPSTRMPEDAVRALAAATRYGQWRAKDHGTPVAPAGINRRIAEDVVHTVLSVDSKGRRLGQDEAHACCGLRHRRVGEAGGEHGRRGRRGGGAGRLPRGAQVDGTDDAPPGRRRRGAGRPAHRVSCAPPGTPSPSACAARRRPARRAEDGHAGVPCVITSDEDPSSAR